MEDCISTIVFQQCPKQIHTYTSVSMTILQCLLMVKSSSKAAFCKFQQNLHLSMREQSSQASTIDLFHLIVVQDTIYDYNNYTTALF